uniref:Uncharacterized protein n=1 Tax=Oryza nivara TaxID=4536 RepID=A0A0E0GI19_ORYNI
MTPATGHTADSLTTTDARRLAFQQPLAQQQQFPCLPSGLPSEGNHHLYSVFLFILPFIRKLLSPLRIGALMRMLYYFYVWTSEINIGSKSLETKRVPISTRSNGGK